MKANDHARAERLPYKYVTIRMTRTQALERGLLTCRCGHPANNHFSGGCCAHCLCSSYREKALIGTLVTESAAL